MMPYGLCVAYTVVYYINNRRLKSDLAMRDSSNTGSNGSNVEKVGGQVVGWAVVASLFFHSLVSVVGMVPSSM